MHKCLLTIIAISLTRFATAGSFKTGDYECGKSIPHVSVRSSSIGGIKVYAMKVQTKFSEYSGSALHAPSGNEFESSVVSLANTRLMQDKSGYTYADSPLTSGSFVECTLK